MSRGHAGRRCRWAASVAGATAGRGGLGVRDRWGAAACGGKCTITRRSRSEYVGASDWMVCASQEYL